jgi:hypothetical protein
VLDHSRRPKEGPLHEGMCFAVACHTKMAMQLAALWVAMSLAAQSVLGRSSTEAFQVDVVGKMLAKFREQEERCLRLVDSVSRVCIRILGTTDDQV